LLIASGIEISSGDAQTGNRTTDANTDSGVKNTNNIIMLPNYTTFLVKSLVIGRTNDDTKAP